MGNMNRWALPLAMTAVTLGTGFPAIAAQSAQDLRRQALQEEANTKVVIKYVTTAFDKHDPQAAFDCCVGATFKQHNPYVPDGREAGLAALKHTMSETFPNSRLYVKRTAAQGDLVFIHAFWDQKPGETRGAALMEAYRLEQGKIVEHWVTIQNVPDKANNSNTQF